MKFGFGSRPALLKGPRVGQPPGVKSTGQMRIIRRQSCRSEGIAAGHADRPGAAFLAKSRQADSPTNDWLEPTAARPSLCLIRSGVAIDQVVGISPWCRSIEHHTQAFSYGDRTEIAGVNVADKSTQTKVSMAQSLRASIASVA